MGATLVHTVGSALIGFCIGLAFYRGVWAKIGMAVIGLVGAVAVHSAFNLSVLSAAPPPFLCMDMVCSHHHHDFFLKKLKLCVIQPHRHRYQRRRVRET